MSDYTTQIRFICESKSGLTDSVGFSGIMEAIENSVDDIFNFEWPIFDEAYRVPLEIKILRHFYTREIGEETFGLWQLRLCDRLNVIMPYYNQLYKSELIKFNPMYDVDLTTEHERANDGIQNRSEHNDFQSTDTSERNNKVNVNEDGIVDFDSNGSLNSSIANTTHERKQDNGNYAESNKIDNSSSTISNDHTSEDTNTTNTNNTSMNATENGVLENNGINESTDKSKTNDKSWGSNITNTDSITDANKRGKNVNRYSDTPQGNVNIGNAPEGSIGGSDGSVDADSVFGNGYLTNVTIVDDRNDSTDKSKTNAFSDDTSEAVSTQNINRSESVSNLTNQTTNKTETSQNRGTVVGNLNRKNNYSNESVGNETANKTGENENIGIADGTNNTNRNDVKKDKSNTYSNTIKDEVGNEKYAGSGTRTNDIIGRIKSYSTEDFIQRVSGKRGGLTYSKMLDEFRKTFLNIDRMILNDLEPLFMGLWE